MGSAFRHPIFRLVATTALLALHIPVARADVLHLVNGGKLEGKVTKVKDGYRVEDEVSTSFVRAEEVMLHERKPTLAEEYETRRKSTPLDDYDAQLALGLWCRTNNLPDKAKWHLMLAVAIRPEDGRARLEAGFVMHNGRWITREESMRLKGLREFQGKWIPAAEAFKLEAEAQREAEAKEAYESGWAILKTAGKENRTMPLEPHAEKLLALGPYVIDPLERGSGDSYRRTRELAVYTLGRINTARSLEALLRRLEVERNPDVLRTLLSAFPEREDRTDVLEQVLNMTVNHKKRGVRRRCWEVLIRIGDPRAIDALVPLVGQSRLPEGAPRKQNSATNASGQVTQVGDPDVKADPYYPAHEALVHLTGELLPHTLEAWVNWWEHKRDTFRFRGQTAPAVTTLASGPAGANPTEDSDASFPDEDEEDE